MFAVMVRTFHQRLRFRYLQRLPVHCKEWMLTAEIFNYHVTLNLNAAGPLWAYCCELELSHIVSRYFISKWINNVQVLSSIAVFFQADTMVSNYWWHMKIDIMLAHPYHSWLWTWQRYYHYFFIDIWQLKGVSKPNQKLPTGSSQKVCTQHGRCKAKHWHWDLHMQSVSR